MTTTFNQSHGSRVNALAFSGFNQSLMCSAGLDQNINFYDIYEKKQAKKINFFINLLFWKIFLIKINVSFICNLKIFLKRIVKTINTDAPLTSLAFNNDGHTIVVGTLYGNKKKWENKKVETKNILKVVCFYTI